MRLHGIWCTRSISLMIIIWFYRSFGTLDLSRLAIRSKWPISAEPLLCSDSTVYERFNGANALNIIYFNASDCVLIVTWFFRSTVALWQIARLWRSVYAYWWLSAAVCEVDQLFLGIGFCFVFIHLFYRCVFLNFCRAMRQTISMERLCCWRF